MNIFGMWREKHFRSGFTLIELAIVLAILGLLLGGSAMLLQPVLDSNRRTETKAKLKIIEDAIALYVSTNFDLPCPSDPTLGSGASNGVEQTPGAAGCTSLVATGGVPWRTLGLTEADVIDGWGRRISYTITTSLAEAGSVAIADRDLNCPVKGFSGILQGVLENRGANNSAVPIGPIGFASAAKAAYILVSRGENSWGGYLPSGALTPATGAPTTELQNINAVGSASDSSPANGAALIFYYEKLVTGDLIAGFDDILRSRTSGQISMAYGCNKP